MAKKYGSESEPGVISLVGSEQSVGVSTESPANAAIVGPADLSNGSGTAGKVEVISQSSEAQNLFGSDSRLTQNVLNALAEGASPVWAVPTESESVTAESFSANEGTLSNAPITESAEDVTFTVGGTELTTKIVHYSPATDDPGAGEVYVEPSTGEFVVDSALAPSSGDEVDYSYDKYKTALENVTSEDSAEDVDQLTVLTENESIQSEASLQVDKMADKHQFAVLYFAVGPKIDDKQNYTPAFDDSRVQIIYPGRNSDGELIVGSYVGMRARLGIRTTPIKRRLNTQDYLLEDLDEADRTALIDNRVVPVQSARAGARIIHDINTVDVTSNADAVNIQFAYTRHVVDYITKTVQVNEERFIGGLHRPAMRRAMRASVNSQLRELKKQSQVINYTVGVEAASSVKAKVDIGLDLAEPLVYVENTINVQE
jgi:hypothetical protein